MSKETDYIAWRKVMRELAEAKDRIAALEKEIENFLTFGQGGASFRESQLLDQLSRTEAYIDLVRRLAEVKAVHITRDRFQMFRQEAKELIK